MYHHTIVPGVSGLPEHHNFVPFPGAHPKARRIEGIIEGRAELQADVICRRIQNISSKAQLLATQAEASRSATTHWPLRDLPDPRAKV